MWHSTLANRVIAAVFVFTALSLAALVWLESRGEVSCGMSSQLDIQFAWHEQRLDEILLCWGDSGIAAVRQGMVADFFFVFGYAALLSLLLWRRGISLASLNLSQWSTYVFAGHSGIWFAAFLDIAENLLILAVLNGATADPLALAIGLLAVSKFALIVAVLALLAASVWIGWRRKL